MNVDRDEIGEDGFSLVTVLYRSTASAQAELDGWASVVEQLGRGVEWIVVDNSEDGADADYFAKFAEIENIRLERRPSNPGFALSSNLGASLARHRWVVFLNPDIAPDLAKFRAVMRAVRANDVPEATFAVGQITDQFRHQGISLIQNVWFSDRAGSSKKAPIGPSGGFGIFERQVFERFGGFSEGLFAWGEDAELAIRMSSAGIPCVVVDEYFDHSGGHSFKAIPELRRRKVWLLARNRQSIAWRHFSAPRLAYFQLFTLGVTLIKAPIHLRARTLGAVVRGNREGFGKKNAVQILKFQPLQRKPL